MLSGTYALQYRYDGGSIPVLRVFHGRTFPPSMRAMSDCEVFMRRAQLRLRQAGGRYQATPMCDVCNVFNRVNLGVPDTNVSSGGYRTINSAQPSRQFQLGVRFDF